MKIGVFGDSFAETTFRSQKKFPIWWQYLEDEYHHEVDCFGLGGSTVLYSAKLIDEKAKDYDIVIWCISAIDRIGTMHHNNKIVHFPGRVQDIKRFPELYQAYQSYLVYFHNTADDIFMCNALVESVTNRHKNIMLVPGFSDPLFSNSETKGFNLYEVSATEAKHFFPNMPLDEIWRTYIDLRPGHITDTNQQILAKCINDNLSPGLFQTDYANFTVPTGPQTAYFKL